MKKIDLVNQVFTYLTVTHEVVPHYTSGGNRKIMWHCKCKCGNELDVPSGNLLSGGTKSCGCYTRTMSSKRMRRLNEKHNRFDLAGEFGIGLTTNTQEQFYFDLEDYEKIRRHCWFRHNNYVVAHGKDHVGIFLHKLIMNDLGNKFDVDHINTDNKFDNRKSNLRVASRCQNNQNHVIQRNNTSGVTGVQWHKRDLIWEAWINYGGKRRYIGRFPILNDAIEARKQAENKHYGDYSYENSQKLSKKLQGVQE